MSSAEQVFSTHRANGHAGLLGALLLVTAIEGAVVHLLLSPRLPILAWALVVLSVQAVWWLISDYRLTVRQPCVVDKHVVRVRAGRRWQADIPRAMVADVSLREPADHDDMLSVTFLGAANVWMRLHEAVRVTGPFGIVRRTSKLALWVDEPSRFVQALQPQGISASAPPRPSSHLSTNIPAHNQH